MCSCAAGSSSCEISPKNPDGVTRCVSSGLFVASAKELGMSEAGEEAHTWNCVLNKVHKRRQSAREKGFHCCFAALAASFHDVSSSKLSHITRRCGSVISVPAKLSS